MYRMPTYIILFVLNRFHLCIFYNFLYQLFLIYKVTEIFPTITYVILKSKKVTDHLFLLILDIPHAPVTFVISNTTNTIAYVELWEYQDIFVKISKAIILIDYSFHFNRIYLPVNKFDKFFFDILDINV